MKKIIAILIVVCIIVSVVFHDPRVFADTTGSVGASEENANTVSTEYINNEALLTTYDLTSELSTAFLDNGTNALNINEITIVPDTETIRNTKKIFANWTLPSKSVKAYAFIDEVSDGNGCVAGHNNWDFNEYAYQPMTSLDNVSTVRDGSVTIQPGHTYLLIVESYDSNNIKNGYGELEITIPEVDPDNMTEDDYWTYIGDESKNLALHKEAFSGSNMDNIYSVVDGDRYSRWQANREIENTYFGVDLGAVYGIDKVVVSWETAKASSYIIYGSLDGDDYYEIESVSGLSEYGNALEVTDVDYSINARYIKIVASSLSNAGDTFGISAYELAVFGGDIEDADIENISSLDYTIISCEGDNMFDIKYALVTDCGGVLPYYSENGENFSVLYRGDLGLPTTVKVNAKEDTEDVIKSVGVGIITIDPSKVTNYTSIKAVFGDGSELLFAVKRVSKYKQIAIVPNYSQINNDYTIWAEWGNVVGTDKACVYLNKVESGYSASTESNWVFNMYSEQPIYSVDRVTKTKDGSIVVERGNTYKLIVQDLDSDGNIIGYGEKEITIPPKSEEELKEEEYLEKLKASNYNLALNKDAFPTNSSLGWQGISNIVDGNNDTRWQADNSINNEEFGVDLGKAYYVSDVLISWERANAIEYDIYGSLDGENYDTLMAKVTGLPGNENVIKITDVNNVKARFIKIVVKKWSDYGARYGITVFELGVFGSEEENTNETTTIETITETIINETTVESISTVEETEEIKTNDNTSVADDNQTSSVETTEINPYNPGFDPSSLVYATVNCDGGEELEYSIYKSVPGLVEFYENEGRLFSLMFDAYLGTATNVTINGQNPSAMVLIDNSTGVIRVNPKNLPDNYYSVIEAEFENGEKLVSVIYKHSNNSELTTSTPIVTSAQYATTSVETTASVILSDELESVKQDLLDEIDERKKDINTLNNAVTSLELKDVATNMRITELRNQLIDAQASLEERYNILLSFMHNNNESITELEQQIESIWVSIQNIQTEITDVIKADLQTEINTRKADVETLETAINNLKDSSEAKDGEIDDKLAELEGALDNAKDDIDNLEEAYENVSLIASDNSSSIEDIYGELASINTNILNIQTEITDVIKANLQAEINARKSDVDTLETAINDLKNSSEVKDREIDDKLAELEGALDNAKDDIDNLEEAYENVSLIASDNSSSIEDIYGELASINTNILNIQTEITDVIKADLQTEINARKADVESLETTINNFKNSSKTKDEEIDATIEELEQALADAKANIEVLEENYNNISLVAGSNTSSIGEIQTNIETMRDGIQADLNVITTDIEALQKDINEVIKANLNAEIQERKDEIIRLDAEIENRKNEISELNTSVDELFKKLEEYNNNITDLQKGSSSTDSEVRGLKQKVAQLEKFSIPKVEKVQVKAKKKRKVTVSWLEVSGAKKYQVIYSTKKNFRTYSVKYTSKSKITLSKLKAKKNYFIKVRGLADNIYGTWSKAVKVKAKK